MTTPRPRILLVHGAWVGAWEFAPIIPILQERGWQVDALDLPTTGSTLPMTADADAITAALTAADGPVVLIGHSYGGVPITQAGDHPNVERVVYVAAFAPDAGESVVEALGGQLPPTWATADGQVSLGADRADRIEIIAADFPPGAPREAAEALADMFRPQSEASLAEPVTRVAWRSKPSTYIFTENDGVLPPAFQESQVARMASSGVDVVRIAHGHAPFQEDPAGFADLVERIADAAQVSRS
ncbi:MAG: alpha/beta hydrolase [Pseudolysinimonas sp.]